MAKGNIKHVDKRLYPESIRLTAGAESAMTLEAAEGDSSLKKFSMTAYTGGAMRVGFGWPVVVDLSGMVVAAQALPILKDHDSQSIVGHSSEIEVTAQRIKLSGVLSGVGDSAQEVAALAANGFPWQASIGASIDRMEFIDRGEKVTVNGKAFEGPLYVARKSRLGEVSFVAMGADSATSARVAASHQGGKDMDFEKWLKGKGFNLAELGDAQKETLQASFDAEVKAEADHAKQKELDAAKLAKLSGKPDDDADIAASRKKRADEEVRVSAVRDACGDNHKLCAQAISEGWSAEKTELHVLRASRPTGPAIHVGNGGEFNATVLEAAACQAIGLNSKTLQAAYKPEVLDAAHKQFKSRLSLHELLLNAAWKNGYHGMNVRSEPEKVLRAAFSSVDIGGITSNVANKFLLETYMAVEDTWRAIASIRPVNDFKAITSYRLTGDLKFEEVGPTGEIKHGTMGEQSYSNQARTYGKMLALTRQDIINDDLGALAAAPKMLGRGAALQLNTVFWTAFMDNASFFAASHAVAGDTGNSNLSSGAGSALSIGGITAAELLFLDQVDPKGQPIGVNPAILLVPNALWVSAQQLMSATEFRDTTSSTKFLTSNPHSGKFTPLKSSYLSNATISGYSTAYWYLLANPADVPTIEVCFLNGQDMPTVESAEADFTTLGIQMRGYFDFGVAKQDFRGGVKSAGS